jgi:hypothetical protein
MNTNMTIAKILFALLISCYVWAQQCPVGTETTFTLDSEAYSYSLMTDLVNVNAHIWADSTWVYALANGKIGVNDYSMITKFDAQFVTTWERTVADKVYQEAFEVTSDENYIVFVPFNALSWTLAKINTSDGNFSIQKSITLVSQWSTIALSSDDSYVYLSGFQASPIIIQFNLSDLSSVKAVSIVSGSISSIYHYGTQKVFVNLVQTLNVGYQHSAIDMSTTPGSKLWGVAYGWLVLCTAAVTPMISIMWESTSKAFQLVIESGDPIFYGIDTSTGALSGSFYVTSPSVSNKYPADLSYSENGSSIFILVRHDSGFHKFDYNVNTNTFSTALISTSFMSYYIGMKVGFVYYAGLLISNSNAHIAKLVESGSVNQGQVFTLSTSSDTFSVASGLKGYSITTDATILVAVFTTFGVTAGSMTFSSPGTYTQSGSGVFHSDIVYRNGNLEDLYIQESKIGSTNFGFPWSTSGSNSISSSLISHYNGQTLPAWISLTGDNENINYVAPAYTGSSDIYYFGVRSVILAENVDEYATITVYQCTVANWQSWSYTSQSTCDSCDNGYVLATDKTLWYVGNTGTTSTTSESSEIEEQPTEEVEDEETVDAMSETTRATVIAGSIGVGFISSIAGSSGQSAWALLNQFQLVMILPLLRSYLTEEFVFFIRDFKFTLLNFSFLKPLELPIINHKNKYLNYKQPDSVYEENSLESGSWFVNQLDLFKVIIIIIVLHLVILLFSKLFASERFPKIQKLF